MRILLPVLLLLGWVSGTSAMAGTKPLPQGFRMVGQNGATGQALYASFRSTGSARATFPGIWGLIGPYFDQTPVLLGGAADKSDQHVQAYLRGSSGGVPVRGLLVVSVADGRGYAGLLFDREDQWSRSLPGLARQLTAAVPPTPAVSGGATAAVEPLRRTPMPDGSGSVDLPAGWRIANSYKGTVDIVGPRGEQASFGGYQQAFVNPLPGYPAGFLRGPYRPPAAAWAYYLDTMMQGAFSRRQALYRVVEQTPLQAQQGGQAAYLAYEVQMSGKRANGLAMVSTAPVDQSSWFFYSSYIAAPADLWPREAGTMWAMWKSWSINPAVFRERMDQTLRSMRETYKIIHDVNDNRQHVYDNVNMAWDQVIRGVTSVEHTPSGARGEVGTRVVDEVVASLNEAEHAQVWRVVPMHELVPR